MYGCFARGSAPTWRHGSKILTFWRTSIFLAVIFAFFFLGCEKVSAFDKKVPAMCRVRAYLCNRGYDHYTGRRGGAAGASCLLGTFSIGLFFILDRYKNYMRRGRLPLPAFIGRPSGRTDFFTTTIEEQRMYKHWIWAFMAFLGMAMSASAQSQRERICFDGAKKFSFKTGSACKSSHCTECASYPFDGVYFKLF